MQKKIFTFLAACVAVLFSPDIINAQTTISIYNTGTTGSYHSGSVNVTGVKYDGNIDSVSFGAAAPYFPQIRGWAEFDLSALPAGATITNATLYFTTYNGTTSSGALNPITGFLGDASTMTGLNLFNAISAGTALTSTIWTANGMQTAALGTAGNTFIQTNIGTTINIGFQRAGYLPYYIYGYPATGTNRPRLDVTFTVTTPCASITSVTASGPSTTCAGNAITLSSATLPYAAGYTFQWQSSPGGTNTWSPISGATNSSYTTTQSSATDYRVIVTCPNTSATMTSNAVAVAQTNFNACYCPATVSYVANEDITNVTLGAINNNSACGSLVGSQGTGTGGADIYSDFTASTVPVPTLMLGTSQTLNVTLNTCSGTSNIRECKAYIDYDQNGLFTDPGEEIIVYASANPNTTIYVATANFTVPATATLGNTRMRIILAQGSGAIVSPCQVLNNYGEAEDYTVNIAAVVNCSGTPVAGTVSGPGSVCNNANFSLSAAGSSSTNGISYQWQSSPTGNPGSWTDISGANTTNLAATQTLPTYYRMYVRCSQNSLGDTTASHFVDAALFYTCYCVSGPTTSFYSDITNITIGTFSSSSTCNTIAPGPGSVQNRYSNYTSGTGAPTPPQLVHSFPINFSIAVTECNSFGVYSGTAIFIDYDQSGTFDAGERAYGNTATVLGNHTVTGSFTMPSTAVTGTTGMRVVNQYYIAGNAATPCDNTVYAGETEDYLIDVIAPPNCSGAPVAGTISSNVPAVCASNMDTVRITTLGSTNASGIIYQWQSSPTGTPGSWSDISGATDLNYKTVQTSPTYYRMYAMCIFTVNTDTTNAILVDMAPFYTCYCSPKLGTTLHTCCGNYISNVSITSTTLNNATTTTGPTYYTFYDTSVVSQKASMAQAVTYTINVACPYTGYGADIWIDWDQSSTFDASEHIPTTTSGMMATATVVVPTTALTGYTGMRVRNNWGTTYGASGACASSGGYETEDYVVRILPQPSCIPASGFTATNVTSSSADIGWTPTSAAALWQIQYGPAPYTLGTGTTVTTGSNPTTLTTLAPATQYTFHVRDICGPNDTSMWVYGGSFTTACVTFNGSYTETFNGTTTPNCWTNSAVVPYGWMIGTSYSSPGYDVSSATDHTGVSGSTFAWVDNSYVYNTSTTTSATLLSPVINTSTISSPQVRYYVISHNPSWISNGNNKLVLEAYDFTISDWVQLDSIQQSFPTSGWQERILPLTGVSSSNTQLRFRFNSTATSCCYNDILIDDVHVESPLAIRLDKISATNQGSANRIDWNTLSEETSDQFELQRSSNGKDFTTIYGQQANGKGSRYTYMDNNAVKGMNYYRLRMVAANGSADYSETVSAFVKSTGFDVEAFPNPVSHELTIKVTGVQGADATVQVTDVTGKVIKTVKMDASVEHISMSGLANGIYLIKYSDASHARTIKVNKQ